MKEIKLEAPVFIIFSEYLGYVSPFTNLAEEWCDGKIPPIHMQKVIMVEAKCILRQMRCMQCIELTMETFSYT